MYIGSTEEAEYHGMTLHKSCSHFEPVSGAYVPGIVKLFDEILVNAMDNWERDHTTRNIHIELPSPKQYASSPKISVRNDGRGIPVVQHSSEDMLVPELIMGHLLTGSNFDDSVATAAGGRHGFGAKLTNIFSEEFTVETADSSAGKRFRKTWRSNMCDGTPSEVSPFPRGKGGDYTHVEFKPDLSRFGGGGVLLKEGTVHALYERAYQAAAVMGPLGVKVHVNGAELPIKNLADFASMCNGTVKNSVPLLELSLPKPQAGHWQAVLGVSSHHLPATESKSTIPLQTSDGHVECCSFVNGMRTYRGGTHVQAVVEPVAVAAAAALNKQHKGSAVSAATVKNHLRAFISARLPSCAFDSQAKEKLVSDIPHGYAPSVSAAQVRRLLDSGLEAAVMATVNARSKANSTRAVRKAVKDASVANIPKLEDANWAGGRRSNQCTLILTEGDSAKALAMAGLAVVGRDRFGVFPLKGKVLNVRDLAPKAAVANTEVAALVSILGLDFTKTYEDCALGELPLRYGHVMIMADQDTDGSHIKGLLVNLFHTYWPHLLHLCDGSDGSFLQQFVTPVVKARRGKKELHFFSSAEYQEWSSTQDNLSGWKTKYYKGLGTSTSTEGRSYFSDLKKHRQNFRWGGDEDNEKLQMAFSKQHVSARKEWLGGGAQEPGSKQDTFKHFVDQELVHFSKADIMRSIPGVLDGLKPSQRKVLHSVLQRPNAEVKVAQLAGFVSEFTAYHHGEASLLGTIVNMSQDYVGSNNVNLLCGIGQFGTRLAGGKDAASARYIFTQLAPATRLLFPAADDALLPRVQEDGRAVEPHTYVPIAPLLLMNGAEGIGTGWSTSIPPHCPQHIIETTAKLVEQPHLFEAASGGVQTGDPSGYTGLGGDLHPWARGYNGEFLLQPSGKSFVTTGKLELDDSVRSHRGASLQKVIITELPFRKWTEDYRTMLRRLTAANQVANVKEYHSESTVHFELDLVSENAESFSPSEAMQLLKLQGTLSASNMHAVDIHGSVVKIDSPMDIFQHTMRVRRELYEARLQLQAAELQTTCLRQDNQIKFVKGVIAGDFKFGQRSLNEIAAVLRQQAFSSSTEMLQHEESCRRQCLERTATALGLASGNSSQLVPHKVADDVGAFKYLLDLPISSMSRERIDKLQVEIERSKAALNAIESSTANQTWLHELNGLLQSSCFAEKR